MKGGCVGSVCPARRLSGLLSGASLFLFFSFFFKETFYSWQPRAEAEPSAIQEHWSFVCFSVATVASWTQARSVCGIPLAWGIPRHTSNRQWNASVARDPNYFTVVIGRRILIKPVIPLFPAKPSKLEFRSWWKWEAAVAVVLPTGLPTERHTFSFSLRHKANMEPCSLSRSH